MANTIRHKRSSTASAIPTSGSLSAGELAINTADGKLFLKKDDNSVVQVGAADAAIDGGFPSDNYSNITTIDGGTP